MDITHKERIEVEYSIDDFVNLALEDVLTTSHDFDLNTNLDDVDDQSPTIV